MTSSTFLELFFSLTIQCTLVLLISLKLTRTCATSESADRLWGFCHIVILTLVAVGTLLPHIRLLHTGEDDLLLNYIAANKMIKGFSTVLETIWISGVAVLSIRTFWSLLTTTRLVKNAQSFQLYSESGRAKCSAETTSQLTATGTAVLCSDDLITPFCWQLQKPVIVLPESLNNFPDDELDSVLRHELAHLEAKHPLRLFLQRIVEIIFWFHPLVWITSWEASLQRELSSDRRANHTALQATAFLRSMARLADYCVNRTSSLAAGMGFGGVGRSILQRRVDHLLSLEWSANLQSGDAFARAALLLVVMPMAALIWIPVSDNATGRSLLSPWPQISSSVLREFGISVRDYEVDNHRLQEYIHRREGL